MSFYYEFPAVRGMQAAREFYIAMVPLKMIPRLFPADEEYLPPEFRAQRRLNESRIPVISRYILNNRDSYVFSALAASIDGSFSFAPMAGSEELGTLKVDMSARFVINDGQHRKAAILQALREDESLGEETIPVVLFADKGLARSQQIFTDLNKNAVKTSNSISELYDSRDQIAVVTRKVISQIPFLDAYTDKEKDNLGKFSSRLFTLNTFYQANREILGGRRAVVDERSERFLLQYWTLVSRHMSEWRELERREITKKDLRENYICTQGIVIRALGRLGQDLFRQERTEAEMEECLAALEGINWQRSADCWMQRAVRPNGRIITSSKAETLITNVIKLQMGLPLTEEEQAAERRLAQELERQEKGNPAE